MYFSAMHPLKGKINIYFFCFTKKSCQETLGFGQTGMKYPFFLKKSTSFKIYDHFKIKKHTKKLQNRQKFVFGLFSANVRNFKL